MTAGDSGRAAAFVQTAWFRAGGALLLVTVPVLLWSVLCTAASSGVPWNAARLAPSFALAQGLPVYALRESGQQLGWFYGPGFVFWNLPATLAANPTPALFVAGIWNVLTWLVPVAVVLRAAGVAAGVVGADCQDVDRVTRAIIDDAGWGQYFIHRTGHGIGMEAHEDPYMVEGNTDPIRAGYAFSVEPGIYLPGRWGIRLEDIVVATDNGPLAVNSADHRLVALS
ncbi:MAG TPA: M24 family metallopeptidase [Ilumatobacteraceae bacterium]|nr:M24 family metallopeptidase [Ilumatobacteraceae bacterium]